MEDLTEKGLSKGLQNFLRTVLAIGIPFPKEHILYIAPPSLSFPGDRSYEAFSTLDGKWDASLKAFCKEKGILCFSPFALALPRFPDRVHLLPEGQIILGEVLLQFIKEKDFFSVIRRIRAVTNENNVVQTILILYGFFLFRSC